MRTFLFVVAATTALVAGPQLCRANAKIESQEVGPVAQIQGDVTYVVSPHGVHLASVARKGTRMVVTVDGVTGPKFDEVPGVYNQVAKGPPIYFFQATVPVVFCEDGSHYAYVGRQSKDWVVMLDGKELCRTPVAGYVSGASGSMQLYMAFTSPDGKHLMFAQSAYPGFNLWVDGQLMPAQYTSAPIVCGDGSRYAYIGVVNKQAVLIVDGKDAGYYGDDPQFTADGQHLFTRVAVPGAAGLAVDGKPRIKADGIAQLQMAPVGNGFALVLNHSNPSGQFVVFDGQKIPATDCNNVQKVVISPDGKHCAALCNGGIGVQYIVADGKKGQEYPTIAPDSIIYSPDSSRLGYAVSSAGRTFFVIDGDESDAFTTPYGFCRYFFSPDSKHVAFIGLQGQNWALVVDGKTHRFEPRTQLNPTLFAFSADGSRYAFLTTGNELYVDGKSMGLSAYNYAFSPDGKHVACPGVNPNVNAPGMLVDGQYVYKAPATIRFWTFTPDSQHLCWLIVEPSPNPGAVPPQFVTYLDGKRVAACESTQTSQQLLGIANTSTAKTEPSWDVDKNGVLTLLAPDADSVKRITVTPSSDTSIATMIADAQAAEAKAKADAEAKLAPKKK